MGGIRPLKFVTLNEATTAAIVLVTDERSAGSTSNPWDDLVDIPHGRIVYWGDAKFDSNCLVDDFSGNRALRDAFNQVLDGQVALVPPILHFSKRETGKLRFNGLCVLDQLELTWFEDHGRPVRNYRAHLTILDEEFVDVAWLQSRMMATSRSALVTQGPTHGWLIRTGSSAGSVWAPLIRSTVDQLPPAGSQDAGLLSQLAELTPTGFEAAVVTIFRELDEVRHNITRTRPTGDGGFDFVGTFTLPPPIQYEIPFLGEAKRYSRTTPVGAKDVSRLVARLTRGQYGVFVTTSYFSNKRRRKSSRIGIRPRLYQVRISSGSCVRCVSHEGLKLVRLGSGRFATNYGPLLTTSGARLRLKLLTHVTTVGRQRRRTRASLSSGPSANADLTIPISMSSRLGQFGS